MIFLTKHPTQEEYNEVKDSLEQPSVALVGPKVSMKYIPITSEIVTKFNVTDAENPTRVMSDAAKTSGYFNALKIDDVKQDTIESAYTLSEGEHTIKYTLTKPKKLEGSVFVSCTSMVSVEIPKYISKIDGGVFNNCASLSSITVAAGNTKFDSRNNCNAIIEKATNTLVRGCSETVIPNDVTAIGDNAFNGSINLEEITIPNAVTSIGNAAFASCSGLTSIEIPDSVTSVGNAAFASCASLTSATIGSGVTSISTNMFVSCTSLTSIEIPDSVTSIGNSPFAGCTSLSSAKKYLVLLQRLVAVHLVAVVV